MTKTEYTISIPRANLVAMAMVIPIALVLSLPMYLIHYYNIKYIFEILKQATILSAFKFAILITIGIFIHELLHGIGWVFFTKKKWKVISFGIKWEYLTPYCHCNEALIKSQFLVGAILPLIVLGLIPVGFSYYSGSITQWFFGFFFTIAAGGDIIAIWMLRKVKKQQMVLDHPSELGFIVLDNDR